MAKKKDKEIKSAMEIAEEKLKKKSVESTKDKIKEEKTEEAKVPEETARKDTKEQAEGQTQAPPIKLTFHSYLIMLSSIGWQFLGKMPNPQTGKIEKNSMQVKEIIDLLEILEEKTRGNLTKEEEHILKSTLSSLRLNYVGEINK